MISAARGIRWGLALALVNAPLTAQAVATPDRVNLVLFLVDDLGWADTAVAMAGEPGPTHRRFATPNIARLAARGMRFGHAYAAAPVCTPSRTAILTGRMPARTHITYWTLHPDRDRSSPHPTLLPPPWRTDGLQPGADTLAERLRAAGYRTIFAGKAHFGAVGTAGADPLQLGFDVNHGGHGAGAPGSYLGLDNFRSSARRDDPSTSVWDVPGLERWHGREVFLDDCLADEAVAELRRAASDQVPFFLWLAPYGVHTPITRNPRFADRDAALDPTEQAYATMVATVDAALGRVLDTLDELGITERTLVVFTSDNGGLSAHGRGPAAAPPGHNAPLRSGKGSAYEGGVRVPAIVAGPGVKPGASCDTPIIGHDWFATLLATAGNRGEVRDGFDLTPLLRGEALPPRTLFWHFPHFWGIPGPGIAPFTAARRGAWKAIWWHAERDFELYDLDADPGEATDRARSRPEVVAALAAEMAAALDASGAQLSLDRQTRATIPGPLAGLTFRHFDLARDRARQVVVDREPGRYLGHVTTALLEDGKTLLAAYPQGHGRGPIVLKRSRDGGLTFGDRLPVPASFATSRETPTIHRVVDAAGQRRLILWSGLWPARLSISSDDGDTWSELAPGFDHGGIVVMASVQALTTPGHYLGLFHDDGRFATPEGQATGVFTLYRTNSQDGGLTWTPPQDLLRTSEVKLCEPGCIRAPDGRSLAVLLREEARAQRSQVIFSADEGQTWTAPRPLPFALCGDRHVGKVAPDGRLVVVLRDRTLRGAFAGADLSGVGAGSPTEGDFVAWVGTFGDLRDGSPGQYRIRLLDNRRGYDCGYAGLELLPDGTFVATTYGHWDADQPPWIVSVRFTLAELDAMARG